MRDLIRFVWRGALGGAILPALIVAYYLFWIFGTPFFWVILISSFFVAVPGAIVGTVLWLCALVFHRISILWRVIIGMATTVTFLLLNGIISAAEFSYDPQFFREQLFSLIYCLAIGGMAGWVCPAARIYQREPELSYRERVREYEAAQAEREFHQARAESAKSRGERLV